MANTYTSLSYHIIFSTKFRKRRITTFREELYRVIGGIARNQSGTLLEIGGVEDHVHMLIGVPPKFAVADMVRTIKANSAKWVNERSDVKVKFNWQTGYSAFTVSQSNCDAVARYIQNQQSHHQRMTFTEELVKLLRRHGVDHDPRYIVDAESPGADAPG
ncbi:MAG: IS200/IS605 family transposase [Planctomycetales bacterium]|nr:IS200/IS605 family transposase [Planctomycetales bacterium]